MLEEVQSIVAAILLGALAFFYGDQIWLSSERAHQPAKYDSAAHTKSKTDRVTTAENADDRIATYTLWLAVFNGLLVIVAAFQVRLLVLADITARDQAAQLKKSSDFAETQNAIIAAQTDIQRKQQETQRLEFIATHRPRLRIRRIWPVGKTTFINVTSTEIKIIVANTGEGEANITSISMNVIFERDKTNRSAFQADSTTSRYERPIVVLRGQQANINVFSTLDFNSAAYSSEGQFEALAIGVIGYEDALGGAYLTGFSRLYDPVRNRFRVVPPDDPETDREYED